MKNDILKEIVNLMESDDFDFNENDEFDGEIKFGIGKYVHKLTYNKNMKLLNGKLEEIEIHYADYKVENFEIEESEKTFIFFKNNKSDYGFIITYNKAKDKYSFIDFERIVKKIVKGNEEVIKKAIKENEKIINKRYRELLKDKEFKSALWNLEKHILLYKVKNE